MVGIKSCNEQSSLNIITFNYIMHINHLMGKFKNNLILGITSVIIISNFVSRRVIALLF